MFLKLQPNAQGAIDSIGLLLISPQIGFLLLFLVTKALNMSW